MTNETSVPKYNRRTRWIAVISAVFIMSLVSPYEYSWSLFTQPIGNSFGLSANNVFIGLTYSIYIVIQAVTMFFAGRFADKYGARNISIIGGIITGVGWIASSFAPNLITLYLTYGFGSIGVGIIYSTGINTAVKWFPDRRGIAAGIIEIGFGGGAFAISPLLEHIITTYNYQSAFLYFGIAQLIVITVLAYLFMYWPPHEWKLEGWSQLEAEKKHRLVKRATTNLTPKEMVKTWQWTAIFISFFLIVGAGLAIIGHLVSYGRALGFTITALFAVYMFPFFNGFGRFVLATGSDYLGRPYSLGLSFIIAGVSAILISYTHNAIAYLFLIALFAFTWGPLFSLFPPLVGDFYGPRYAGNNYGLTYIAKAASGLLAGYGFSVIFLSRGIHFTLVMVGIMAIIAGIIGASLKIPKASLAGQRTETDTKATNP